MTLKQLRAMKIDDLELSVRARNCLILLAGRYPDPAAKSFETLGEVLDFCARQPPPKGALIYGPGLGRKIQKEILAVLRDLGASNQTLNLLEFGRRGGPRLTRHACPTCKGTGYFERLS